ncbi:helix-turn-helix transcriptional regulator [Paraburkholderia caffeinilytica]|uniref:helix-turn-helix transcriptional regulator n=1 Tax=Paraburkholderia caffeinilytica TaxID=1761016 RepID=UPI0038B94961
MSPTPFHLYVWPQRLLMLAPAYASAQHRHHLAQIAFGLDGPVVYESPHTGLHRADLLLVPPDTPHAHPAFGTSAVLYLEPESIEWARFPGRESTGLVSLPFNPQLRTFARGAAAGDAVAAQSLVDTLIEPAATSSSNDDALVAQVCALVRQRLDGPITLAALAQAVHRSPSRLAHRFRDATGVPVRRYVLWCRLRAAAEAAMRGSSLTDAAHAAGFSDSAHLSRTFRSSFGIAPSFMFERSRLSVTFCETTAGA